MPTIIVCTNFSETSRNALSYTCSLITNKANKEEINILLLHIYTIPANYSADGIALATINNALFYAEEDLQEELEWVHEEYPHLNVKAKVTTGTLLYGITTESEEAKATLVVLGTGGNYGELWSWDSDILHILRDLPVPVLTIPPTVSFKSLQKIAFACNLKIINQSTPFNILKNLVRFTEAKLHVVFVISRQLDRGSIEAINQIMVHTQLNDIEPIYHTLYEKEIVNAIGRFIEENKIQLLLVMPKKHGVWESLFHKSFTKELSRLNLLPIMALH